MNSAEFKYSAQPTRNPLRYGLALWRLIRHPENTDEAAIVEIGFMRSRLGRKYARWTDDIDTLASDPRTAPALRNKAAFGPIDLTPLAAMPEGTLGRSFAGHCRTRGIDPNLVRIPLEREEDAIIAHLYETHDLWHVVTGWGNDEVGEVGLGGFYAAQTGGAFFAFMMVLLLLNTIFMAPDTLRPRLDAFAAGYAMGNTAEPMFGFDWANAWNQPLAQVRARLNIDVQRTSGEGIRAAA
jgi:ubiquinone biosynthesis protein Coq4